MSGNLKVDISIEIDELIRAIKDLTECIDQLTQKMNHLKQTTITVNVGNVKAEMDVNRVVKQIEESLLKGINRAFV